MVDFALDTATPARVLPAEVSTVELIVGSALPEDAKLKLSAARVVEQRASDAAQAMSQRFRVMMRRDYLMITQLRVAV